MAMAIVVQIDQYAIARHDADVLQRHGIGRLRRRRIGGRGDADVGGPGIEILTGRQVQIGAVEGHPSTIDRKRFGGHPTVYLHRRIGPGCIGKGICRRRHCISPLENRERCMDLKSNFRVGK